MIGNKITTVIKGASFALLMLAASVAAPDLAHAFAPAAGGCGGDTIGSVMCNTVESSSELPYLLAGIAYMAGLVLAVMGVLKLKDHVLNPNQTPLSESLKRFIVGGAFFSLPIVTQAAYNTVADGIGEHQQTSFHVTAGAGLNQGLDAMLTALMADIWTPVHTLVGGFAYLAGLVLVVIGISRLLKSSQEGPRGPGGVGTIMTFLVGGALLSADAMMGAFSSSMFGTATVATYADLTFSSGLTGPELDHIHNVISAVLAFLMVIGWVSFIRGWFIVRDVAEGSQQASLMAGMTHIFGGALAVNLGPVLNAVQQTFGITAYGISFA